MVMVAACHLNAAIELKSVPIFNSRTLRYHVKVRLTESCKFVHCNKSYE
jgi:hypothetical protein